MAEEPTQVTQVLPPENVDAAFRPYYALLVDRAIAELRAGRSDIELRVELQKITPSKAVLETGFDTEEFIREAILFAKSVFSPKVSLEGLKIDPILSKLGAPEPPKSSELFDVLKKLKERERLIRTAGFETQRAALRNSLDEITQRLGALKIPTKQAGAFPFELASSQAVGISSPATPQQQGLISDAQYLVTWKEHFGGIYGDQTTRPQELTFFGEAERNGVQVLDWKTNLGAGVSFAKSDLVSAEVIRIPPSALQSLPALTAPTSLPATSPAQPATLAPLPTTSPLEAGQESLTLSAGTEETRRAIDAKLAEGFVLSKVTTNPDGTATFVFTRVSAVSPQPAPAPAPQPTVQPAPIVSSSSSGSIDDLVVDFGPLIGPSDPSITYPLGPPNAVTARRIVKVRNAGSGTINFEQVRGWISHFRTQTDTEMPVGPVHALGASESLETYVDVTPVLDGGYSGSFYVRVNGREKAFGFGVR